MFVEKRIRQQARLSGDVLPPDLASPPRLQEDLIVYLNAFYELCTDRPVGMGGVGAIPFSSIIKFAEVYDFDSEMRDELLYLVRRLDETYINYTSENRG